MTLPLLASLPWVLVVLYGALRVRLPRPLPAAEEGAAPLVSVVVPARNEERSLGTCLRSLARSRYGRFEVVVVDDRSDDRTAEVARTVAEEREAGEEGTHGPERVRIVEGEPLPEGWIGKPWACWQGYREARGDLLLFTDADTVHGPDLLRRAVRALDDDRADAITVAGRQELGSFWEKVVQPQIFVTLAFRFPDLRDPVEPGRCGRAAANGQYLLFRREAYEAVGGHEGVRGEVVEDLRLAQRICRSGRRLSVRMAEEGLATRMYRSLGEMVEGWSKNLAIGAAQTLPPVLGRLAPPAGVGVGIGLWVAPPLVLAAWLAGLGGATLGAWSAGVCVLSGLFWATAARRMKIAAGWGAAYPLGAAVASYILARSWLRGRRRVEWKGRTYRVDDPEE